MYALTTGGEKFLFGWFIIAAASRPLLFHHIWISPRWNANWYKKIDWALLHHTVSTKFFVQYWSNRRERGGDYKDHNAFNAWLLWGVKNASSGQVKHTFSQEATCTKKMLIGIFPMLTPKIVYALKVISIRLKLEFNILRNFSLFALSLTRVGTTRYTHTHIHIPSSSILLHWSGLICPWTGLSNSNLLVCLDVYVRIGCIRYVCWPPCGGSSCISLVVSW